MYYFFRDLESGSNLADGREYHAAGLVDRNGVSRRSSGKDMCVEYIHPFTGEVQCEWRVYDEVELYTVDEREWMQMYNAIKKISKPVMCDNDRKEYMNTVLSELIDDFKEYPWMVTYFENEIKALLDALGVTYE